MLHEIKKRQLKAILISAVFRKNQPFFKWYGSFMRSALFGFQYIFTQDEASKTLLQRISYTSVSISGDTRFDRVYNQLKLDNSVSFIEAFKNDKCCVVFGSTWPEDDKLFLDFINTQDADLKYVIAPHNIKPSYIASLKDDLKVPSICYSELSKNDDLKDYKVFILDTIGYLSKVYSYADIAYVGGGAGSTGLHNILEPAVFGVPIIIGKTYEKFPEAKTLISLGGITSIASADAFAKTLTALTTNKTLRIEQGAITKYFINENRGAVQLVLDYLKN